MKQLIGNLRVFVQHLAGDEMISGEGGKMSDFVEVLSDSERYTNFNEKNCGNRAAMSLEMFGIAIFAEYFFEIEVELLGRATLELVAEDGALSLRYRGSITVYRADCYIVCLLSRKLYIV